MQLTRRSWFVIIFRIKIIQSDLIHMALNTSDKEIEAGSHAPSFCNFISFLCCIVCIGSAIMYQLIVCIKRLFTKCKQKYVNATFLDKSKTCNRNKVSFKLNNLTAISFITVYCFQDYA